MTSRNRSARSDIAVVLAILLLAVSVLSSFKRHIRFSGPPQSISEKYQALQQAVYDAHQITFSSPVILEKPPAVCWYILAVSDENREGNRPGSSLYVRPPPHA